jgi:hypothetical protein
MTRIAVVAITTLLVSSITSVADVTTLTALQTGAFYDGAPPDNSPTFQNYFVGYSTSPGLPRTPERRSFFWFDLSSIDGEITKATMVLTMPEFGVIFGKAPGPPPPPPPASDMMETFRLGMTPVPSSIVTDTGISAMDAAGVFASMVSTPIAPPVVFALAAPPPPPPEIHILLDATGIAKLQERVGLDIVLSGWMPSWTPDFRMDPMGDLVEGSELIFGHSDVIPGDIPMPTLIIEYTPVPEPSAIGLLAVGALLTATRRRCRRLAIPPNRWR